MSDWESDGESSKPAAPWEPPPQHERGGYSRGRGGRGRGDFQDRGRGTRGARGGRGEGRGGRGEGRGGRGEGRGSRGSRGEGRGGRGDWHGGRGDWHGGRGDWHGGRGDEHGSRSVDGRGGRDGRIARGRGSRGARQGGRDGSLDRSASRSPEIFGSYQGGYSEGRDSNYGESSRGFSRGARGRGRGGRGRGAVNGVDKPPEKYIPAEFPDDEDSMFASGVEEGANFDNYDFIEVKVTGENAPSAIGSFSEAGLRPLLLENIEKSGYHRPTPIQKMAIPIILARRDLMACAQTGSGKTAAFLLPVIQTLMSEGIEPTGGDCCEPQAVIVSPTRELAIQIYREARKFALQSCIIPAIAYGGVVESHQLQKIQRGCHILVATPGRLNSFVTKGKIGFSKLQFFILDEADRMLDMGFLPEMEKMLHHSTMGSDNRNTLMFSATFPPEIQQLAGKYLRDYLFVTVGIVGSACADVEQKFMEVTKFEKNEKILEVLKARTNASELTLVFVSQKRIADFLAVLLCENDIPTTSIHGDRYQSQREQALSDFETGKMSTLIATGVASRGLDIKNVAHVINFDMPKTIDEYVHRIGRTGRLGNTGRATSFYDSSEDRNLARALVTVLEQAGQQVPDFVLKDAESAFAPSAAGFNGEDIRTGQEESTTFMAQEEDDEDWD